MADVRACRLCKAITSTKRAISLFSSSGVKGRLAARISTLLDVPEPTPGDLFSSHICEKCRSKITFLEKTVAELARFKDMARSSLENRGKKRVKETSGKVGVTPDTARQRPPSKLSRKRLSFGAPGLGGGEPGNEIGALTTGGGEEWEGVPLGSGGGGEEWEGVPLGSGGGGGEEWEGVPLGSGGGGEEWEGVPLGSGGGGEEWEGVGGGGEEWEGVPLGSGVEERVYLWGVEVVARSGRV